MIGGTVAFVFFLLMAVLWAVDPTQILGVGRLRIGPANLLTYGFAIAYFALTAYTFIQALVGRPLVAAYLG